MSLVTDVADRLAESIRSFALRPGEKLPTETEIVRNFGVSRTVVREAISSLQAAGLIETRRGIGSFVRPAPKSIELGIKPESIVTVRDVLAVLELRISLETEAASLAAARRTDSQLAAMRQALDLFEQQVGQSGDGASSDFQFHLEIAYATGNRYFVEVMSHLGTATIPRTRVFPIQGEEERLNYLKVVHQQHSDIYTGIQRKDPEAARTAMRAHLTRSYDRLRRAAEAVESQERPTGV
jgi:GntR family transcriptional regulator, transcriptional repressor for pyruvate dehydrogenase complex